MAEKPDNIGTQVLTAAASQVRLKILKLLASKGPLSYTEIMFEIELDPIRDAGKFVYHLKNLMQSGLINIDKGSKKYEITELGLLIVKFSRDLDEYLAVKRGQMYVRSSRLAIEEFDRSKISRSLVIEAGIPLKMAEEIAAEAEERLIKLKTKYLTAPLIREFINSILIERKLEEYRHKLTRVGMPLYDVTQLIRNADDFLFNGNSVEVQASSSLMEEYVLLNGVSRDVADAHLSGLIHIDRIETLVLKPSEISHDLRSILQKGILNEGPPKNFAEALCLLTKIFQMSTFDSSDEGIFDEFNVFLAPYIRDIKEDQIGEHLLLFLKNLDIGFNPRTQGISLGLETSIPQYFSEVEAIGPGGKYFGNYSDFTEESNLLLNTLIEKIEEYISRKPLFNPRLILKVRREVYKNRKEKVSSKVLSLAKGACSLFFAVIGKSDKVCYTANALRLSDDWSDDFQFDCFRTGNIGTVFINLPRIAFEAKGNQDRFNRLMERSISLAVEALKSKGNAVRERLDRGALPLISSTKDHQYFLVDNASYTISFVGLTEAMLIYYKLDHKNERKIIESSMKQVEILNSLIDDMAKELNLRIILAQRPSEIAGMRLMRLDLEKYGKKRSKRGELTSYSSLPILSKDLSLNMRRNIDVESRLQRILKGGHLTLYPISSSSLSFQKQVDKIIKNTELSFFTFSKELGYCRFCKKSDRRVSRICRKCGSNKIHLSSKLAGIMKPVSTKV